MHQGIYLVKQQKRSNKINIISQREFWEKKVETFIQMFLYGRDTPQQFIKNMLLMGFQEEEVSDFLEECSNE